MELPRFLEVAEVEQLLRGCDCRRKVGRRDCHSVAAGASGVTQCEVTGLELEDIDWNAGTLRIRGKGARMDRLP